MAQATRVKGGKLRVKLDLARTGTYAAPCGFTSKSLTFSKGIEEVNIPDCDDPDKVDWVGRDATSLSISIEGEGVLAVESGEAWLHAFEEVESVPCKIEIEFPAKTIVYTGNMHASELSMGAPNARTVTLNVSMASDGEMVRSEL